MKRVGVGQGPGRTGRRDAALGAALAVLVAAGLSAVSRATAAPVRSQQGGIVIGEVQYDPAPSGSENAFEWIELHNAGEQPVPLAGWQIADNRAADPLPDVTIAPGGFLVVAGERFLELFPAYAGPLVTVASIGNGLGNSGDRVQLIDAGGTVVDALSYGDDAGILDPPVPPVAAGHSLERVPAGVDTDAASDWADQPAPSPGGLPSGLPPTDPPPATLAPPPPGAHVVLNEYLAAPRDVDWDGDGTPSGDDEWIEVFNAGDIAVDLRGWQLDDIAGGGSSPFVVPDSVVVPARGHRAFFKRETGIALNNGGDTVRLLGPDGVEVDTASYTRAAPDASWARSPDGGEWADALTPSPGGPNGQGGATPPPDPGTPPAAPPSAPPPLDPTATTPPAATDSPPPDPGTPAASGTPAPAYLPMLISEVLYDPAPSGTDAAWEWVELYNPGASPASLAGWSIGDRTAWDALGDAVVPSRGYVVVAARDVTMALADGAGVVRVADGVIGGGLGNAGDVVRLRGPTGAVVDAVGWGSVLDAFDPSVPVGPAGSSIERLPSSADADAAEDWWLQPAPSPGRQGERHEGPARVRLNEILPAPWRVDWDGDGTANSTDEWIELYNPAPFAQDLSRWELADPAWSARVPDGTMIGAESYLVLYRADTGLALDHAGEILSLVRPDGVVVDQHAWADSPGDDRSFSRVSADGWSADWDVTPGAANRPHSGSGGDGDGGRGRAEPPARAAALGELRALGRRARVVVRGRVIAPPGLLGARAMYIGDETGGVRVFLMPRDGELPAFAMDDAVAVIGTLGDFNGEREVRVAKASDVWWDGVPGQVLPVAVATGRLGEDVEGRLVRLEGRIVALARSSLTLDDGTGPAHVVLLRSTSTAFPRLARGARWAAVGIAGQSATAAPWEGGYRLMPRMAADIGHEGAGGRAEGGLARLPATGRGGGSGAHPARCGPSGPRSAARAHRRAHRDASAPPLTPAQGRPQSAP